MTKKSINLHNVEICLIDGLVDEIFVKLDDGTCVFHMERMSDRHFWAAAYSPDHTKSLAIDLSAAIDGDDMLVLAAIPRTNDVEIDDSDPETGAPTK